LPDAFASQTVDVAQIAARIFGLATPPSGDEGPNEITEWDSLGSLKLLLALEDALGQAMDADALAGARTIGEVQQVVDRVAR
jgi:acyl carrier protein